eukprot:Amastigsp_a508460_803.p1 type:complete len:300 gc:universal Amastigsp_a508460_803:1213-314(-)
MASTPELEAFFAENPEPAAMAAYRRVLADVVAETAPGKKIVVVTSGGTTVPLERNTVRFIDNFSTGSRGACLAECFLALGGYTVVFAHRKGSLQPFLRQLQLDTVADVLCGAAELSAAQRAAASARRDALSSGALVLLEFTSVQDYLFLLRVCGEALGSVGARAMFVLAAAVSDFYVPRSAMAEHKIQSSSGPLHLELSRVPKALGALRHEWVPSAFVVSFKLETDPEILFAKARGALSSYGVHAVVANILATRTEVVHVLSAADPGAPLELRRGARASIEELLAEWLSSAHVSFAGSS